ncbi:MAG: hypothetical protein JEZ12_19245 [Desulfobacterium sp.]|nr:hypothetical protein [Desulfobacterium sp.]
MKKSNITNSILVPILFLISVSSIYYPDPYNEICMWLFAGALFSCSTIWISAAIRNKKNQLINPNPIRQAKALATTTLNKIEKTILIYSIFIIIGCFFGMIFYPVIDTIMKR